MCATRNVFLTEPEGCWQQGFENFLRAFARLEVAIELCKIRPLSELEQQGLIHVFNFTHELAWNVMKDYFTYQGNANITGSRDAVREAFANGLVQDGESWMDMIKCRNQSSHTYNQSVADMVAERVIVNYFPLFVAFAERMESMRN